MSSVETGQMSAVETGQMSAAETGQMSADETGQMSAVETRQMLKFQIGGLANTSSGRRGRLIGSLGYILAVLGRGTGPRGEKMAAACPGTDSQDLATILDPFRAIFVDWGQTAYLRLEHCDIGTIETSET